MKKDKKSTMLVDFYDFGIKWLSIIRKNDGTDSSNSNWEIPEKNFYKIREI